MDSIMSCFVVSDLHAAVITLWASQRRLFPDVQRTMRDLTRLNTAAVNAVHGLTERTPRFTDERVRILMGEAEAHLQAATGTIDQYSPERSAYVSRLTGCLLYQCGEVPEKVTREWSRLDQIDELAGGHAAEHHLIKYENVWTI